MWMLKAPPNLEGGVAGNLFGYNVIHGYVLLEAYDSYYWFIKKGFTDVTPDFMKGIYAPPETLLLVRHGGMGDMMVVTAVARAAKRHWPNCKISLCCTTVYKDLLKSNPNIDFFIEDWLVTDVGRNTSLFTEIFDFTHSIEFNVKANLLDDYYSLALKTFGFDPEVDPPKPEYFISPVERDNAKKYLVEKGMGHPKRTRIGLALRASMEPRSLSNKKSLEVVEYLAAQPDVDLVLFGDTLIGISVMGECPKCGKTGQFSMDSETISLSRRCSDCKTPLTVTNPSAMTWSNVLNLERKLSVREMAALVGQMDALVTVDTGVAHVAAAFGIPQVGLMASWDGHCPMGSFPNTWVIQKPYPCAPCFSHINQCRRWALSESGHPPCMDQFTPVEIWEKLQVALSQRGTYYPKAIFDLDYSKQDFSMQRDCPFCGARPNKLKARKGRYTYYGCQGCGSLITNVLPNPQETLTFYDDPVYAKGQSSPEVWEGAYNTGKVCLEQAMAFLPPSLHRGTVVDLGTCLGRTLQPFLEAGWDGWGVDSSRTSLNVARESCGVKNVLQADVSTLTPMHPRDMEGTKIRVLNQILTARTNSCAVVILSHVIEHLDNPATIIQNITKILAPRGLLVLAFPCYDEAKTPNPMTWIHINAFSAGEHVNVPSKDAAIRLVTESGLVVRGTCYQHPDALVIFAQKTTLTPHDPNEA